MTGRGRLAAAAGSLVLLCAVAAAAAGATATTAADPVGFHGLSVTPPKAFIDQRGGVKISFALTGDGPADVIVEVLGAGGEVRRFSEPQVAPGAPRTLIWDGLTASGRPVPDGTYRVLVGQAGGAEQLAGRVLMLGHFFPVRGPHGTRGAVGMFHAPRNDGRIHEGFDVTGKCGTPLAAVRAGTVTRKGYDPVLYGNFVQVKGLGERQSYFYAHMVKPSPYDRGDHIQSAAIVGRIGQTGNAAGTPCHLHFEILIGGTPIDPEPQLRRWDRVS
jgi:murein DD-endopeptidase MepM/ murein hydrolase activator NlpD